VVAAQTAAAEHYELDANGNRIKDGSLSCMTNELNQLVQRGEETFTYDSLGNMTSGPSPKGEARYSYNGRGLLVSVRTAAGETYYGYDAFGRRVYKRANGSFTRYAWAGQQLLSEVTTAGEKTTRRDYIYFPERPFPLAMRINGAVHYIHSGRLGEPLCVTNARNAVVWKADYTAFGQARIRIEQISQPFRLAGQYFDEETGLHYALMRYYNPELGRYLTMDPMRTEGGSLNFYIYCDGDPLNRYDPTGGLIIPAILIAAAIGAVIGAAIGAGVEAYRQHKEHGEIKDGWAIAKAAGIGAVIGAIGGAVGALVEAAAVGAMAVAAAGALAGGISAAVEYCAEVALTETTWDWGMLGVSVGAGVSAGAVTAGVGGWVAARAARKAAAIAAREAEEVAVREVAESGARGVAKISAKNPDVIALGLSTCREKVTLPNGQVIEASRDNVLGEFARNVDGSGKSAATWTKFDPVVDQESGLTDWGATIKNAMKDANEIHFNREGMTNFDEIVKNPDPSLYKPPSTNWELATLLSDPTLKPKVKIYNGPGNPD
jgi:RHS repeat-associated protein